MIVVVLVKLSQNRHYIIVCGWVQTHLLCYISEHDTQLNEIKRAVPVLIDGVEGHIGDNLYLVAHLKDAIQRIEDRRATVHVVLQHVRVALHHGDFLTGTNFILIKSKSG